MSSRYLTAIWFACMSAGLCASASDAIAQTRDESPAGNWQVCNETSYVTRIATGIAGGEALRVSGWDLLYPGQCKGFAAPVNAPRYLLAESDSAHLGGIREWKGDVELCAGEEDFTAEPDVSCDLQNLKTRGYLRVSSDDERTLLVEPDAFGDKAVTAGLQRLLRDAGYRVRRIDGLSGLGTTRRLNAFLKDEGLPRGMDDVAQMTALRKAAKVRREALGLTFCNETEDRVWSATAFRREGIWQSRGWWAIESGACEQVVAEPLSGMEPHIFALQEQTPLPVDPETGDGDAPEKLPDRRLRASATEPAQFCISEGRFSAVGKDDCRDRGYTPANFRALSNEEDTLTVTFTAADFVTPSQSGLRR